MSAPLLGLVQQLLGKVTPAGRDNVMATCPLHRRSDGTAERSPSFAINVCTGQWMCHSCGLYGSLRKLMRLLGMSPEVLNGGLRLMLEFVEQQRLQELEYAPRSPPWLEGFPADKVIPEETLGLFDYAPTQMLKWGFTKATLRAFDVGYDKYNHRITFPLRDHTGQLVGFSGRALLESQKARYKVYGKPEYERWGLPCYEEPSKSLLVWNFDQVSAYALHTRKPRILVVEGFKVCLWFHQLGLTHTIALMGSSMSDEQQRLLERLGGELYLWLDEDDAGQKKYDIAERLDNACTVKIPQYAEYNVKQPDLLTLEQIERSNQNAPTYLQWKLNT